MGPDSTFIGLAVGPYRTVVASSTGVRDVLPSAVGWPTDAEAREAVGRDAVFGQDLLLYRPHLEIVRPFDKFGVVDVSAETPARRKAARLLLEHAVVLTRPRADRPVYGAVALPSNTGAVHTGVVLEACREAFDAAVLLPEPVATAHGVRPGTDALVVEITAGQTEVFAVRHALADSLSVVHFGTDHADAALETALLELHPTVRLSNSLITEIKERYAGTPDGPVPVTLPTRTGPEAFDTYPAVRRGLAALVRPVVTAIKAAIVALEPEERLELIGDIILAGPGSKLPGLDRGVTHGLRDFTGVTVQVVADAMFGSAAGALDLATGMAAAAWRELLANRPTAGTELEVVHAGHPAVPGPRAAEYLARRTG
jgi:rod shape-determining protein MreB and related proteins